MTKADDLIEEVRNWMNNNIASEDEIIITIDVNNRERVFQYKSSK